MNEELAEQASLYVLGLLEASEASAFARRLQSDAELRELVDRLDETAAAIAHSAAPRALPPELRAKILGQVSRSKTVAFLRLPVWVPWAIAAAVALSCAYLIAERGALRKRIAHLEERDLLSQIQIVSLTSQLDKAPKATAVIAWSEKKQHGVLKAAELPRNAADQDYQLWMVDPSYKNPVNAGVFHVDERGTLNVSFQPSARVRGAKGFAISLERKGGVTRAEGPIVLLGK